ncbi:OmpA family protein [Aquabacterium sp. CECT 9606]|uniref:OmpA family protein n=1 Tax=Aquabacterium sp. CECT 9606 TaxID=2845822 RepID=UPI001E6582E8|nr:OmpA family protein [Aquabacterium sp. CECT 9606]CAH0352370.1 hypothetical protein AQB9606_02564 [Aquabacterium sp. CECT 9606]
MSMKSLHPTRTLVAHAVVLACLSAGGALAQGPSQTPSRAPDTECSRDDRGRMRDHCAEDRRAVEITGTQRLPESGERELPRLTVLLGDERPMPAALAPSAPSTQAAAETSSPREQEDRHVPRFASGEDLLKPQDRARLDAILAQVKGRPGLHFEVVGHTDVQGISPALRRRFPDNQALGLARARQVADYLGERLGLAASAFKVQSKGPDAPLATPAEQPANWPANRRVEVRVYWRDEAAAVPPAPAPAPVDPGVCDALSPPAADDGQPWRLTVDGRLPASATPSSPGAVAATSADRQRCTDVLLERHQLRLQYDSLSQPRRLNGAAWPTTVSPGEAVRFAADSNYRLFFKHAELRLFTANEAMQPQLLAVLPLDGDLRAQWTVPKDIAEGSARPSRLYWRIRVTDAQGRFDETSDFTLTLADPSPRPDALPPPDVEQELRRALGESRLSIINIPLQGGTVTASGQGIAATQRVRALGLAVPVDAQGRFVAQQLVPRQVHTGEIAVIEPDGRAQVYRRDFEIPRRDGFFVGQADLTVGHNQVSGPAALLTEDKNRYNDDTWTEGRIAFYGKGQLNDRWTITGSLDTQEQPLDDLLHRLDRKDPTSLLRRVDPVDSWATFGDDSTAIEDAPTQGSLYLRIDDGRSHLLWGDYKLTLDGTALAQVSRGLYGLHGRYVGDDSTSFGDAQLRLDVFAAQPGTLAAREDFRGTGGSLYYLRHQDITRGAEKVFVEVRDRDSGLVISRRQLVPSSDYEVDALQGRVLLSAPLSSVSDNSSIIRTGGTAGHPVYLVVDYEYTPVAGDLESLATGGRVAWWATDNLRLGLTSSQQQQTGGDQHLTGIDATLRRSETTYLKVEAARSSGPGTGQLESLDGGFNFTNNNPLPDQGQVDAGAWRVEGQVDLKETGLADHGRLAAYAQQRDAGYSAPGQLAARASRQAGVSATAPLGERTELRLKADQRNEDGGVDTQAAEAQLAFKLAPRWALTVGARHDDKQTDALIVNPMAPVLSNVEGDRTDLSAQLDFDSQANWGTYVFLQDTIQRSGTRQDNDRVGVGARWRATDKLGLRAELSGGDGGAAGKAGVDYQYDDRSSVYMTYALDTGRTDENNLGRGGTLVSGLKSRVTDGLNVYTEHRQTTGLQSGLTHAYGVQYAPNTRWTWGASFENGRIESETVQELRREAVAFTAGYADADVRYTGGAEYRWDRSATESRRSWLLKNALSVKNGSDGRWVAKLNVADSDSSAGDLYAARYTEAMAGYAWRPALNDKLNMLFKATWLHDLSSPGQVVATDVTQVAVVTQGIDYQQRSRVLAVDATYDLTSRWTVGGKLAWRTGELRAARDDSAPWFSSTATLAVARVDWKVVRQWDWLLELRTLQARELDDRKSGFLTAIYYHVNENFKVGVGHNFTDFSDNVTDLSYRSRGWFLNMLGKF